MDIKICNQIIDRIHIQAGLLKKESLSHLPKIYKEYQKSRENTRKKFDDWIEDQRRKGVFELHNEVTIYMLGLFDSVGSLGVPNTVYSKVLDWFWPGDANEKYKYHDTTFPLPRGELFSPIAISPWANKVSASKEPV
jgi:hypothetical protein